MVLKKYEKCIKTTPFSIQPNIVRNINHNAHKPPINQGFKNRFFDEKYVQNVILAEPPNVHNYIYQVEQHHKILSLLSKNFLLSYSELGSSLTINYPTVRKNSDEIEMYLANNSFFLDKQKHFLLEPAFINHFSIISQSIIKFIISKEKNPLPPQSSISEIYINICEFNRHLDFLIKSKINVEVENFLLFHISIIIYLSIIKFNGKILEKQSLLQEDFFLHLDSESNPLSGNFGFFKENLVQDILTCFSNFLIVITLALNFQFSAGETHLLFTSLISFLDFAKLISSKQTKKKLANNKSPVVNRVFYNFTNLRVDYLKYALEYPIFTYTYNRLKPLIFISGNFTIVGHSQYGKLFQIGDNFFNAQSYFHSNKSYGYLTGTADPANILDSDITFKKCSLENLNFFDLKNSVLLEVICRENNVKAYIDRASFHSIVSQYLDFENLTPQYFSLKTDYNYILKCLGSHVHADSPSSKKIFRNLLILIELKKFEEYIFSSYEENMNEFATFFFFFFYDFRGRKYYQGSHLITNFVPSRFFIYYGFYTKNELITIIKLSLKTKAFIILQNVYFTNREFLTSIIGFMHPAHQYYLSVNDVSLRRDDLYSILFDICDDTLTVDDVRMFYIALIVNRFISLGSIYKTDLLRSFHDDLRDSVNLDELFIHGLSIFTKYVSSPHSYYKDLKNPDLEDILRNRQHINHFLSIPNYYKKESIGYDASCSGHQIRSLYSGNKSVDNFKKVNLAGECRAYDMYTTITLEFKKTILEKYYCDSILNQCVPSTTVKSLKEHLDLLTRGSVKKAIMTHSYNVSLFRFEEYIRLGVTSTKNIPNKRLFK